MARSLDKRKQVPLSQPVSQLQNYYFNNPVKPDLIVDLSAKPSKNNCERVPESKNARSIHKVQNAKAIERTQKIYCVSGSPTQEKYAKGEKKAMRSI